MEFVDIIACVFSAHMVYFALAPILLWAMGFFLVQKKQQLLLHRLTLSRVGRLLLLTSWHGLLGLCDRDRLIGTYLGLGYQVAGQRVFHIRFLAVPVGDPAFPYCFGGRSPYSDSYEEDTADPTNIT